MAFNLLSTLSGRGVALSNRVLLGFFGIVDAWDPVSSSAPSRPPGWFGKVFDYACRYCPPRGFFFSLAPNNLRGLILRPLGFFSFFCLSCPGPRALYKLSSKVLLPDRRQKSLPQCLPHNQVENAALNRRPPSASF